MTVTAYLTTQQAADRLNVPFFYLGQLLREHAISEPARHGNRFLWTQADLDRAAAVIAERRARRQRRQQRRQQRPGIAAAKG